MVTSQASAFLIPWVFLFCFCYAETEQQSPIILKHIQQFKSREIKVQNREEMEKMTKAYYYSYQMMHVQVIHALHC